MRRLPALLAALFGAGVLAGAAACGAFGDEPTGPTPDGGAADGAASANGTPDAQPGEAGSSACPTPACTGTGCIETSFTPVPANDDVPWSYEPPGNVPVVVDGVLVAASPNEEPSFLRAAVDASGSMRLIAELDFLVDQVAPNKLVGVVAWVGPSSDELFVAATATNDIVVCALKSGLSEAPCSAPVARWTPGTWHHLRWVVDALTGVPVKSALTVDCQSATTFESDEAVTLATTKTPATLDFHVGVTIVYGLRNPAKVRIDNVYRRIEAD